MSDLYSRWKAAKDQFFAADLDTDSLPPEFVDSIQQGFGLGPALRGTKIEEARKALSKLQAEPAAIWVEANQASQPPRPSAQMISAVKLRSFNLADGAKPVFLKVDPIKVDVSIDVDEELQRLIDSCQEGLKIDYLGRKAEEQLSTLRGLFTDTIVKVDKTIAADPTKLTDKTNEANQVLKHYAGIVQDTLDRAVQAGWQKYAQRQAYLKEFQVNTGTKIALTTISISVAAASFVLSFGTAWVNLLVIAKGVMELAKNIDKLAEGIETTGTALMKDQQHVTELNAQREAAKKKDGNGKGKSQTGSKAKELSKEVLAAIMPITRDMIKAASAIEARCNQFLGQISRLDSDADGLVSQLNAARKQLSGVPDGMLSPGQRAAGKKMAAAIDDLFAAITGLHKKAQVYAAFGENVLEAVKKLRKEDSWATFTEKVAGGGPKAVAIYGLANFVFACAAHGHSLIPL
ncbi:MAG TPA: hypothetical protein VMF30_16960 [Pirellulales bacterium]|nr:hypothetical protein [Pirellulales bacterium]